MASPMDYYFDNTICFSSITLRITIYHNNNKHHDQVPKSTPMAILFQAFTLFSPGSFAKLILTFDWAFLIAKSI
jgi:hypothetical protein